jgi:hypothetical protein
MGCSILAKQSLSTLVRALHRLQRAHFDMSIVVLHGHGRHRALLMLAFHPNLRDQFHNICIWSSENRSTAFILAQRDFVFVESLALLAAEILTAIALHRIINDEVTLHTLHHLHIILVFLFHKFGETLLQVLWGAIGHRLLHNLGDLRL